MKWLLLIYLFLETLVTINLGGKLGGFNTFLEMFATALIGAIIIANFKKVLSESMMAIMSKQLNAQEMVTGNLLALIGAVLLILPGFLSDLIGLVFQFSSVQTMIASRMKAPEKPTQQQNYTHKGDDNVIDVEIVEHNTISK